MTAAADSPYHRIMVSGIEGGGDVMHSVTTSPFARGSVSIRLYPHNELAPTTVVDELCRQARLALQGGFDGVMTSEHHGGFAGYMAQPLQMATFFLEESTQGWAAASPLLLPLRATALVAEEVA